MLLNLTWEISEAASSLDGTLSYDSSCVLATVSRKVVMSTGSVVFVAKRFDSVSPEGG